jgi:hypothetical protein
MNRRRIASVEAVPTRIAVAYGPTGSGASLPEPGPATDPVPRPQIRYSFTLLIRLI